MTGRPYSMAATLLLLSSKSFASAFLSQTPRASKFARSSRLYSTTEVKQDAKTSKIAELFKRADKVAPRLRFAPSPTGSLHVGGARTALYNWLLAQQAKLDSSNEDVPLQPGFILRVEDTDEARSTRESEQSVLEDLKWLGLTWEEGPDDDIETGPYRQSERMRTGIYQEIADYLVENGHAYKCFMTNEELEEMKAQQEKEGENTRTTSIWRDATPEQVAEAIESGKEYTVRFKVPANSRVVINDAVRGTVSWDAEKTVGDFVLLRSNGMPVYNFCVSVDDALMGITTVIRAEEHLTNTVRQVLTLDALGASRPTYAHCSLILGQDKQKLSKRHGATSCTQFKEDGYLPDAMINYLSLLGWNDGTSNEIFTRDELIEAFELERVVKSPAVFDEDKLKWINSQHLKRLELSEVVSYVKTSLTSLHPNADDDKLAEVITILARQFMDTTVSPVTNMETILDYGLTSFDDLPSDAKKMVSKGYFYNVGKKLVEDFENNELPLADKNSVNQLFFDSNSEAIIEDSQLSDAAPYDFGHAYKVHMKQFSKDLGKGYKGQKFFHPIRLALTGEMSGQDVTKQLALVEYVNGENVELNCNIVSMTERIEILKNFLETIPEGMRKPIEEVKPNKDVVGTQQETKVVTQIIESVNSPPDPLSTYEGPSIAALDIRVGEIKECWNHEEADRLLCEVVDVGEVDENGEPQYRNIASGLREYYAPEDIVGRKVLVLCNLKARKLVGFPSHGMLLCASSSDDGEKSQVQLISVPTDAKIGERITVPDVDFEAPDTPMAENKIGKKKILDKLLPHLKTSKYGVPEFCDRPFMSSAGVCTSGVLDGTVG